MVGQHNLHCAAESGMKGTVDGLRPSAPEDTLVAVLVH